jgi:4-amino-4-deoxy-L-arabinose transferase-like glycosyltransferase
VLFVLLGVCVLSRLVTSIFYIEDPDSLRFALSLHEFDVANLQPHFPGYPVFVWMGQLFYLLTHSYGLTFSLIGGLSTFLLIYTLIRIIPPDAYPLASLLGTTLLLINPLLWLMGNRYMPDLMGTAVALWVLYGLIHRDTKASQQRWFWLAGGLLLGIRLSYAPLLIVPGLWLLMHVPNRSRLQLIGYGLLGTLLWLVPMLWDTGWATLLATATQQTTGHFTEFGGTIETEPNLMERLVYVIRGIWADGLGGYWIGRNPITLLTGLSIAAGTMAGVRFSWIRWAEYRSTLLLWILSATSYLLWIYLGQNVIYKSRHVLPLLPMIIITMALGGQWVIASWSKIGKMSMLVLLLSTAITTGVLVYQHTQPTAIAQIADQLSDPAQPLVQPEAALLATPLVRYYLAAHQVDRPVYNTRKPNTFQLVNSWPVDSSFATIGDYRSVIQRKPTRRKTYYHNPYVNRMWAQIDCYIYE